jgi:hypothetical protein
MEISYILSDVEKKLVLKDFNDSIELPQKYWREFASLLSRISQSIEDDKNFRKPFGDGFYASVNSNGSVVLESSDRKVVIAQRYWMKIQYYLPVIFKHEQEVELLCKQLKSEQQRRQELEQELLLTKQQVILFYLLLYLSIYLFIYLFIYLLFLLLLLILFISCVVAFQVHNGCHGGIFRTTSSCSRAL